MYVQRLYIKGIVKELYIKAWIFKLKGKVSRDYARPALVPFPMKQSLILNEHSLQGAIQKAY
jgi:hypothetical protein